MSWNRSSRSRRSVRRSRQEEQPGEEEQQAGKRSIGGDTFRAGFGFTISTCQRPLSLTCLGCSLRAGFHLAGSRNSEHPSALHFLCCNFCEAVQDQEQQEQEQQEQEQQEQEQQQENKKVWRTPATGKSSRTASPRLARPPARHERNETISRLDSPPQPPMN